MMHLIRLLPIQSMMRFILGPGLLVCSGDQDMEVILLALNKIYTHLVGLKHK